MTQNDIDRVVAECLADFHRRRARGERPEREDYRRIAHTAFDDFVAVLEAELVLDAVLDPDDMPAEGFFPMPFGDYTLLRELGRGAMGVVYEAMDRELGRKVALKVLRSGFDAQENALERFRREARACAQVRHDHIVEIYDVGEVDGRPYYSMALLGGRSLHEMAKAGEAPPTRELCAGLADIADALHRLHGEGIVHRDVKPSNIMVEPSGRMVLADFGLARSIRSQRLTATGQALGTPLYMSPEQVLGRAEEIDGRSDVYGLGATLYEVLANGPLFQTDDVVTTMRAILEHRPRPLREIDPHVPEDVERIALKALEKRREDRFQDAAAMRDDLRAAARGEQVAARPVSTAQHALRRVAKHWPLAAALVLAATVGAVWMANRPVQLELASIPPSSVRIDGEMVGRTRLSASLSPGTHEILLEAEGFIPLKETVDLRSGTDKEIERILMPKDPDDPEMIRRLAEGLQIAFADPKVPKSGTRAAGAAPAVTVVYPRGDVRMEDLDEYRVDLTTDALDLDLTLQFRRGDRVVHTAPFVAEKLRQLAPLPAGVLDGLKAGETVTWGVYPKGGAPVEASFRLVAPPAGMSEALERRELKAPSARIAREQLAIHACLRHGLHTAAFRAAHAQLEVRPRAVRQWQILVHAARSMGLDEDTAAYQEAWAGLKAAEAR